VNIINWDDPEEIWQYVEELQSTIRERNEYILKLENALKPLANVGEIVTRHDAELLGLWSGQDRKGNWRRLLASDAIRAYELLSEKEN
jgi:plasmid stabilization system protein ParE